MDCDGITVLTNTDPRFYPLLGPFLANRAVHAYLGAPAWDDEGKTWLVACDRDGVVAGFAGVATRRGLARIESCYTTSGDPVLAGRLVAAAVRRAAPSPCAAVVRREHADAYLRNGFRVTGETRNFLKLARKGA